MMQLGEQISLQAGAYAARVSPQAGGRLTALTWTGAGATHDLVVPLNSPAPFDPHHWPSGGAFAMAPYSNRLGGATFQWGAHQVRLTTPPGETYALLGFALRSSWEVMSRAPAETVLQYRHRAGIEGWPWNFVLTQRVALDEAGAQVTLRITNTSDESMPAGLGWHPYHPSQGLKQQPQAALRLAAHARRDVRLDGVARLEPHGGPSAPEPVSLVGADLHHQTHVFEDWQGEASMPLAPGVRIAVQTSGARHLVMHAAKDLAYLCLEPVSLLPGALHFYTAAQAAAMIALAPRASRELTWRCAAVAEPAAAVAAP